MFFRLGILFVNYFLINVFFVIVLFNLFKKWQYTDPDIRFAQGKVLEFGELA